MPHPSQLEFSLRSEQIEVLWIGPGTKSKSGGPCVYAYMCRFFFLIKSLPFGYPVYLMVWFHLNEDKGSWIFKWCFYIQGYWQKWRTEESLCFSLDKKFKKESRVWEGVSWAECGTAERQLLLLGQSFGPHCGAAAFVNFSKYTITGDTCSAKWQCYQRATIPWSHIHKSEH